MDPDKFFLVFPGIFSKTSRTWDEVKDETIGTGLFFLFFGLPFILAGAFGRALSDQNLDLYIDRPFFSLWFVHILAHLITLLSGSWMIARMAGTYGLKPGFGRTMRLSVASYIPFLLSQIVTGFAPVLAFLPLAGLIHTVFLFWNGAAYVLEVAPNRLAGFTLLSFFIFLGLGFIGLYLIRMIIFAPVTPS